MTASDHARRPRVLVIDDGVEYARLVAAELPELELVQPFGPDGPPAIADGGAAIAFLRRAESAVDLVLLDMQFEIDDARLLPLAEGASAKRTRRFQGLAILRALRQVRPELPVVLLTSHEDLSLVDAQGELAAQSMTYVLGSDDLDTLRIRVHAALAEAGAAGEEDRLLWGRDRQMNAVRRRLQLLARGSMPIILEGETGTGKSLLAHAFVHAHSGRGPFVTLDLAAVPAELIPAHLFGALRGAYTGAIADRKGAFELAHGGTLLIDEIQNVPLEAQKQLLVVLQERRVRPLGAAEERPVDVKVVAATTESLAAAVAAGRFRQDLYMRLGPATRVRLPPLRDRGDDLQFFAERLVARAAEHPDNQAYHEELCRALGLAAQAPLRLVIGQARDAERGALELAMPEPVWRRLRRHRWPGNMRELAMVIHSLVNFTLVAAVDALRSGVAVRAPRLQIDPGLAGELLAGSESLAADAPGGGADTFSVQLRPAESLNAVANQVERQYLRELFRRADGDFSQMAVALLGDADKARAVRLRLNQLGLKVRDLRRR